MVCKDSYPEHVKTGLQTMPYYLIVPLFYDL